ncbi:MAG TPA: lipid-A-disaccharide synthase [Paludibacter sp.]|nr:lipid-A-disaccharide synthase [Paludibacter sp.]
MRYFIIAGEASGDLHASNLMRELRNADPEAEFCFLGGDLMQAQGGKMIRHYRQMAFMGIVAVLKNARTVLGNLRDCKQAILDFEPDVLILVDYPSFNLRVARFVKENLPIPVFYYISPKLWAWKEYRIRDVKRYVDKMFTILPFETEFYNSYNYQVDYVGNPSVDSVASYQGISQSDAGFCASHGFPQKPIIALLPGSRKQEISKCLGRMIEAAGKFTDYQTVISGAPGIDPGFYKPFLQAGNLHIVFGQTYELLRHSKAAIVNSGTATLETALIGTPEVVVYHVALGRFGYWLKDMVIKVKYISLVNLILGKEAVKELVAHLFTVGNLVEELDLILNNGTYRNKMQEDYSRLRQILGEPGAAKRAAEGMVGELKK